MRLGNRAAAQSQLRAFYHYLGDEPAATTAAQLDAIERALDESPQGQAGKPSSTSTGSIATGHGHVCQQPSTVAFRSTSMASIRPRPGLGDPIRRRAVPTRLDLDLQHPGEAIGQVWEWGQMAVAGRGQPAAYHQLDGLHLPEAYLGTQWHSRQRREQAILAQFSACQYRPPLAVGCALPQGHRARLAG
ncbi:hypothetical protein DSL92_06085 [Billgrantia gudaonensis]|uniref:Uncharacterized protein n=1 Tax=Billgrantia gudaonensis TaxID=376427 RepID=A0A432JJ84_9GAMM|nr:hypothetical protein DSL92_06085 [Halomonas gudaonensis]